MIILYRRIVDHQYQAAIAAPPAPLSSTVTLCMSVGCCPGFNPFDTVHPLSWSNSQYYTAEYAVSYQLLYTWTPYPPLQKLYSDWTLYTRMAHCD